MFYSVFLLIVAQLSSSLSRLECDRYVYPSCCPYCYLMTLPIHPDHVFPTVLVQLLWSQQLSTLVTTRSDALSGQLFLNDPSVPARHETAAARFMSLQPRVTPPPHCSAASRLEQRAASHSNERKLSRIRPCSYGSDGPQAKQLGSAQHVHC